MKQSIAFITGISGQDGSYLAELLLQKEYIVHGLARPVSSLQNIQHLFSDSEIFGTSLFVHQADITDAARLRDIVRRTQPSEVYHLAAQSHPGRSFELPEIAAEQTATGTAVLLDVAAN